MNDQDLADRALDAVKEAVGSGIDASYTSLQQSSDMGLDGNLVVRFGKETLNLDVVVKGELNAARAAQLAARLPQGTVIVSRQITPTVGRVLRDGGVCYLDLGGNVHLEAAPFLLHVSGMPLPPSKATARAFSGEGLKVIFLLLLDTSLTSAPYRRLSELSGVSHGVVQYTMNDLIRLEYMDRTGRTRRRLGDIGALLDRWADGYTEALRPKLTEGTFAFAPGQERAGVVEWRRLDLALDLELWSGEPAAALATGYLRPSHLTLYSRTALSWVMKRLRIAPSEEGAITVVRPFWTREVEAELPHAFDGVSVPTAVTYADLLATSDPRNAEVALMLRDQIVSGRGDG